MQTVGTIGQMEGLRLQYMVPSSDEKPLFTTIPQVPELWVPALVNMEEYDPEILRQLRIMVTDATYYTERLPIPMNEIHKMYLDDIKVDYLRKNTKLPLTLSAATLSALIAASLAGLPWPYGLIASIAFGGPLFVSLYGLKNQPN